MTYRHYRHLKGVKGTCITGKVRFSTRAAAMDVLERSSATDSLRYTVERVYTCDRCAGWHLTSEAEHPFIDPMNP